MKPSPEINSPAEQAQFNQNLVLVNEKLKQHDVDYALVGGLAIKGLLGEQIAPHRPNGTVIDLDAVALGPDEKTIEAAITELKQLEQGREVFPDIGIESVIFADSPPPLSVKDFFTTVLSSLRIDSQGRYFLNYRKIEEEISPETMKLQTVSINGIPFPTFPAKTLWFRYLIRGGNLKMKDNDKLDKLQRYIIDHNDQQPADDLYKPYLEFAMKINEKYKIPLWIFNSWWVADDLSGGKLSGSKKLYKGINQLHK